jgi:beta-glucosidase
MTGRTMKGVASGILATAGLFSLTAQGVDAPLYRNASTPVEQRVEDLLARMTLQEKLAQITTVWTRKPEIYTAANDFDPAKARQAFPAGIGHIARPSDLRGTGNPFEQPYRNARQTVELVNAIQHYAMKDTRLGIPVLFHEEGLHGYAARDATSFPQAIALASSWDPELLTRVFSVAGREIRARGVQMVLAPVVDVAAIRAGAGSKKPTARTPTWSANWESPRSKGFKATRCRWDPTKSLQHSST